MSQTINPYDASRAPGRGGPGRCRRRRGGRPGRRSTTAHGAVDGDRHRCSARSPICCSGTAQQVAHTESLDTGKTLNEARADVDDTTAVFHGDAGIAGDHAGRVVTGAAEPADHPRAGRRLRASRRGRTAAADLLEARACLAAGNNDRHQAQRADAAVYRGPGRLFEEADIPPGVLNLLLGQGGRRGRCWSPCSILHRAGDRREGTRPVWPVALELGGKNPNIVFAHPLRHGCTYARPRPGASGGSRLIVQDLLHDSFVAELSSPGADRTAAAAWTRRPVRSADLRGAPREGGACTSRWGCPKGRSCSRGQRPADAALAKGFSCGRRCSRYFVAR